MSKREKIEVNVTMNPWIVIGWILLGILFFILPTIVLLGLFVYLIWNDGK